MHSYTIIRTLQHTTHLGTIARRLPKDCVAGIQKFYIKSKTSDKVVALSTNPLGYLCIVIPYKQLLIHRVSRVT